MKVSPQKISSMACRLAGHSEGKKVCLCIGCIVNVSVVLVDGVLECRQLWQLVAHQARARPSRVVTCYEGSE